MIRVGVVVPTLNNKEMGYEALESIKGSKDVSWTPYIIDNWNENRVLSYSWNLGVVRAFHDDSDFVLIINDDVIFSPHTLTGLVERFLAKDTPSNTVVVTGRNHRAGVSDPNNIKYFDRPSHDSDTAADSPDFSCFMINKRCWEEVGTFDENFIPAYFEDNDYHRRIRLLGLTTMNTSWAPYYHYGSITQNYVPDQPVVVPPMFDANRDYYTSKWGGEPGNELFFTPYNDPDLTPRDWIVGYRNS